MWRAPPGPPERGDTMPDVKLVNVGPGLPGGPSAPGAAPPRYTRPSHRDPVEDREFWGRRANALEDEGHGWREAERIAFDELQQLRRQRENGNG